MTEPYTGPLYPSLRAQNGPVALDPRDWLAGTLFVGGIGSGKSSAMLAHLRNSILDPGAATILIDPKTSTALKFLDNIPPDCPKRVWYLNLARPAFGMSPLRIPGVPWQATTDLVVESLRDVMEDQVFQASRSRIENSVLGALALARKHGEPPSIWTVRDLLVPEKEDIRAAAAEACIVEANLRLVRDYFEIELPGDLRENRAHTRTGLGAPRNKLDALLKAPSLQAFFNHTTEKPLSEIVRDREILIVDAALAETGDENARLVCSFILRMLNAVLLQQQLQLAESERGRVHLFIDEAWFVINEHLIDMLALLRESGLTCSMAMQFFDQLLNDKIRGGLLNLLGSYYLFRISNPKDAEQATRITQAVFTSMMRDDPDSRARMRTAPDVLAYLARFLCLASWLVMGARAEPFIGATYPMPERRGWAQHHLAAQSARVGEYPSDMDLLARRQEVESTRHDEQTSGRASQTPSTPVAEPRTDTGPQAPQTSQSQAADTARPPKGEHDKGRRTPPPSPRAATDARQVASLSALIPASPVRALIGASKVTRQAPAEITPTPVLELAVIDDIVSLREELSFDAPEHLPRLTDNDLAALKMLDRAGFLLQSILARTCWPGRSASTVSQALTKLWKAGLISRSEAQLRRRPRGRLPVVYAITKAGLEVAKNPPRRRDPVVPAQRQHRGSDASKGRLLPHDMHTISWVVGFSQALPQLVTDHWRTPRYASGCFFVPQVAEERGRKRPITRADIPLDGSLAMLDMATDEFSDLRPDASMEIRVEALKLTSDILVELDRTDRASYNRGKLEQYDAFLAGWCLAVPRYRKLGTRPVVVFVCSDEKAALALLKTADETLTGRIGVPGGEDPSRWYYPARDHLFVAVETDIHHGSVAAFALPPAPPAVRAGLRGPEDIPIRRVALVPEGMVQHPGRDHADGEKALAAKRPASD